MTNSPTRGGRTLVDLSLSVSNAMPGHRSFPPPVIVPYAPADPAGLEPDDSVDAAASDDIEWGATYISMVDHVGTHVDAPLHTSPSGAAIDELPLSRFYGRAVCLDLRHIPDLGEIDVADLDAAVQSAGVEIDGHIVLLCTGFHARHWPVVADVFSDDDAVSRAASAAMNSNPGITATATHWLADRGSLAHGVEGPSTDIPGTGAYPNHKVCRDRGLIHYEWLVNLEQLVGLGEFWFSGLPIKFKRGTGSPVRAVAEIDSEVAM